MKEAGHFSARSVSISIALLFLAAATTAFSQPQTPPVTPNAVVLVEQKAAAWLTAAGIPARTVSEADLPAALPAATLVVLPLQEVRRPETVAALRDYAAKGGRIIATFWGPVGMKTPVADPLSTLLAINVTGFSGRGNITIVAAGAGKALFNGAARLSLGRGYSVIASAVIPPLPKTNGKPSTGGTAPQAGATPSQAGVQAATPLQPPFVAGRWIKQDGRPLRDRDTAVVQTPATLWISENLFAMGNDSPDVRRWTANAAVLMAPALRLPAKQFLLSGAQTRLDAARSALVNARAMGVDAPLNDAQASLDNAANILAGAGKEMDFTGLLRTLDTFDGALLDAAAQSTPSRPVEVRAVWIEQTALTKSNDEIRRLVGRLADAKFNVILPEIVYWGRAAFPSSVYPQDARLVGSDPLRSLITEARKRGMEVHPWVWALCAGYYGEQGPLLSTHPEWAARDKAGRTMTDGNRLFWLSPSVPAVRTAIRNVVREIAARYDVDGIHLDYIRYDSPYFDYSDDARAAYKAAAGVDPLNISSISPEYAKWTLWREAQVNSLVREIHEDLATIKPRAKLSAAVFPTPELGRRERLQDWAFWLKNGWLDWVAPMTYTRDVAELNSWLTADISAAQDSAYLVAGLGSDLLPDVSALALQAAATRSAPAQGLSLFAASHLSGDMLRSLKLGAFRNYALLPWADPKKAASTLAASAASLFNTIPAPDSTTATAARAASSAVSTWASASLPDMAGAPPIAEVAVPALADTRYNEPRAMLENARRIVSASLSKPPAEPPTPSRPPITVVANPHPLPSLTVRQITANITVDGKLDEPAWKTAAEAVLERTTEGTHARVGATARVMRDATTLYIGFTCPEPNMAAIKATITGRDGRVYDDDSVEVFLAPNEYGLPYYHFVVGASGGVWDDRAGDSSWNGRWTWGVSKDAASWSAELAIPFSALNAQPAGSWKANLTRNRTPDGTSYVNWSVTYGSYHTPDRFGTFEF